MEADNLRHVLVVDDDKVDRLMVSDLLEGKCSIVEAQSGEEVRERLDTEQIDCVLLDYLIPGCDSLALLKEISGRNLPVVMLTGEGNEDVAVRAMKHGAQDYISKRNLSGDFLLRTITSAVATVKLKRELASKGEELSHANESLKQKVVELERLNQDLENLLHIAAHDLREPLRNLYGYCDLAEGVFGDAFPAEGRNYFESMRRNISRLTRLIDDLRALSRIAYGPAAESEVNLSEIAEEVKKDFERALQERNARVEIAALPTVSGFRPLFLELYRNLISNALKYSEADNLVIECTVEADAAPPILGVKNNGSSIPATEMGRLFQPFTRLPGKVMKEGTGMGLALCKKIVERHGGRIWLESESRSDVHVRFTFSGERYAKN